MAVIGVDSSGHVGNPPIWIVATKGRGTTQKHSAMMIDEQAHSRYVDCVDNWHDKLSAIIIFKVVNSIIAAGDTIVIDDDFQQQRKRARVTRYILRLFGIARRGEYPLSYPNIAYATYHENDNIKHVHQKTQWARNKTLQYDIAPELLRMFDLLKID